MKQTIPYVNDKLCEQCRHFYRHYTRIKEHHYHPTAMGHCVHPRVKPRMVDSPACDRFSPRPEPQRD